jgi:Tfp pilus assembly protein PilF
MADIRGYRLFRRRYFAQARVWFEEAIALDPSFEPALFHAARAAALLGDVAGARRHLDRLRGLGTPMSRRQLEISTRHEDFARLRRD